MMKANISKKLTSKKVEAAFKSFKGFKAPRLDEIRPLVLKPPNGGPWKECQFFSMPVSV